MLQYKMVCVGLVALIAATDPKPNAKDPPPPCEQVCSMQWGPEWTKCGDVSQCQSYVELRYRQCVKSCEKDRE